MYRLQLSQGVGVSGMLRIAICDDEQVQRDYLSALVKGWADESRKLVSIEVFPSGEAFLFEYHRSRDFDILLLDIEMKQLDGVRLAEILRQDNERLQIVFITGHEDYMQAGYDVSALHYLIKPAREEKLFQVLSKAEKALWRERPSILLPKEDGMVRVICEDITYIEAFAHNIKVTTKNGAFMSSTSITAVEAELNPLFLRCHRSYLVNLGGIKSLKKFEAELDGGERIPISRRLYQKVNQAYLAYFRLRQGDWDEAPSQAQGGAS